jgi:D-glutamate N-acetyltransferase
MSSRFLILAEGAFSPLRSKTANACIRYTPDHVVAVIDSTKAGSTAENVLGFGGKIPVVSSLADGLARKPDSLLIGIAPPGGQLPPSWRALILEAMDHHLEVWSGLHTILGDDSEFAARARSTGMTIHDLRKPPEDLEVARGRVRELDDRATVILTVGTDCNIGKMTTQLQLRDAMRQRGMRVAFAATGQTGILIEGWGISVDAVIGDFIAGAAERLTLQAAREAEIVLVEGQGSIIHPSYSGVTYGLLHGSLPHGMIMCAQPTRTAINNHAWVKIPPLPEFIDMQERAAAPLRPAPVIAVALNTYDLDDATARDAVERVARETGLPTTDPVRFDPTPIIDAIDTFHRRRFANSPLRDAARLAAR